jgi:hypothetical protein
MPNIINWKLRAGTQQGQETADQKLAEGMKYVEMLKNTGMNVISVENTGDFLKITTE